MNEDLILEVEDIHRLNVILTQLIDKSRIDCALLINKSGRLLTSQAESGDLDKTAFAALVVGSFVSSTMIANMIGENEFTSMYHQGQKKHSFIAQVDNNTIITILFDNRTTLDKVKTYSKKYNIELAKVLRESYDRVSNNPYINLNVTPE